MRDYIHVTDVATVHYAAAMHLQGGGTSLILNGGCGFGISTADVLQSVTRVTGLEIPTRTSSRFAGDPPVLIADNAAIQSDPDWYPGFDELDYIIRT